MTDNKFYFYCPVCKQKPEVKPYKEGFIAMCSCNAIYAKSEKSLLRKWNRDYCANERD